jgi:tetratricopeptide (TPR) repeat protein
VEVADALEVLGNFYHSQAKPDKAQPLYESAFKIYKRFVGVNYTYPSVPYLIRMAKAFQSLGDDKSAGALMQKVLTTDKEVYGSSHPLVAIALMDLAGIEKKLGESKAAHNHFKEALEISSSIFSSDHPMVIKAKAQLN